MEFKENTKPIYLQIADRICDDVMSGRYLEDTRIPSVRDFAGVLQVNANTMMRTYEYLSQHGIIYNKRGIGFFIDPRARELIREIRERTFFNDEMKYFFERLVKMDVTPERLTTLYKSYLND